MFLLHKDDAIRTNEVHVLLKVSGYSENHL